MAYQNLSSNSYIVVQWCSDTICEITSIITHTRDTHNPASVRDMCIVRMDSRMEMVQNKNGKVFFVFYCTYLIQ